MSFLLPLTWILTVYRRGPVDVEKHLSTCDVQAKSIWASHGGYLGDHLSLCVEPRPQRTEYMRTTNLSTQEASWWCHHTQRLLYKVLNKLQQVCSRLFPVLFLFITHNLWKRVVWLLCMCGFDGLLLHLVRFSCQQHLLKYISVENWWHWWNSSNSRSI